MIEDFIEAGHGVAGEADGADFSGILSFDQSGDRFLPDLVQFHELNIVEEDEVEVVGAHALHGDVE